MGQFVHGSSTLIYKNATGADILAGSVISFNSGALAGVNYSYIPAGESGVVALTGTFELPTPSTFTCTQGAPAYWDATGGTVIASVASGSTAPQIGVFAETRASSTGSVPVVLNVAGITKTGSSGT